MKRIIAAFLITAVLFFTLSGCMGDTIPVTVVIINSTDYELEQIIFEIPPTRGSYSPMYDLVTSDTESLKPGEEREVDINMYESDFGNQGTVIIYIKDDETRYTYGIIAVDGKNNKFNITCDNEMNFILTVME